MRKFFEICPRPAPRPPVPPGLGSWMARLCSGRQAVTAPERSSLPRPGCHRWLHPTLALSGLCRAPGFQLERDPIVWPAPPASLWSGPLPRPTLSLRWRRWGQPHSLPAHLEEGGRDERGSPWGPGADCGLKRSSSVQGEAGQGLDRA